MGNRLHVAKTYKVEYSQFCCFNWKIEEFHDLLNICDCYFTGDKWDEEFDVSKEDIQKLLAILENPRDFDNIDGKRLSKCLISLECTAKEAHYCIKSLLETAEPNDDYVHFSFF